MAPIKWLLLIVLMLSGIYVLGVLYFPVNAWMLSLLYHPEKRNLARVTSTNQNSLSFIPESQNNAPRYDAIFVHGCSIDKDGQPSVFLKSRLDKAITLFGHQWAPEILVSGGFNRQGYFECEVMQGYLIAHGIPSNRIWMECGSTSTYENVLLSIPLLEKHQLHRIVAVSSAFHVARCKRYFQSFGIDADMESSDWNGTQWYYQSAMDHLNLNGSMIRELLIWALSIFRGNDI